MDGRTERECPEAVVRCAVLIVNWNSWSLLARCLECLAQQTFRDFRVFVLDNASSVAIPGDLAARFPEVVFEKNGRNLGFAGGNNALLKRLRECEWVALLNPDAFPEPRWLESLLEAAQRYPQYSAFASRLLMASQPDRLDGDGDAFHVSGLAWRRGHGRPVPAAAEPREVFAPCAAAALYRKDALMDVDGFDEDYFCYFEDVDLGFRLQLRGHRSLLVPAARVRHVGSATTGGRRSDLAVYYGHRNLIWTYVKNMPGILFWVFLVPHVVVNIGSIVWWAGRGKGGVIGKSKWDALKGVPRMWSKRGEIQRCRRTSLLRIVRLMDKSLLLKR